MSGLVAGLVLGVAGSLHCVAMCGPLMLALRGRQAAAGTGPADRFAQLLLYHGGRLGVYAAAGVAAGAAGRAITMLGAGRALSWLAGAALLTSALSHLAGGWRLPAPPLAPVIERLARAARSSVGRHPMVSAVAGGAVNACLPCGLVYAALTAAASFDGPAAGLGVMLAFGVGTLPALAGVWLAAGLLTPLVRQRFRYATPAALAVVGVLLIVRGAGPDRRSSSHHGVAAAPHAH